MESPLVSIIIPFYNEEKVLKRAIESALNQTYVPTEIILVNDGSKDNSQKIAESFCENLANVYLINSPNESLGAARNKGLKLAKGEYVVFLDADDELIESMIEKCIGNILNSNCDLVVCKFQLFAENIELLKVAGWNGLSLKINGIEAIKAIFTGNLVPTAWGKLYRKSAINGIKFPEKVWFEDNPFLVDFLLKANTISLIDKPLLKIHSHSTSITRRVISKKRVIDLHKTYKMVFTLIAENNQHLKVKADVLALVFTNQIRAMLDVFILIMIDKNKLQKPELKNIRNTYLEVLQREIREISIDISSKITFKIKLLQYILMSPKYIGWQIPELIIYILKTNKYKYLKKLKG